MDTLDIIHKCAAETRRWAEANANNTQRERELWGMCARASAHLVVRLRANGLDAVVHVAKVPYGGHAFVEVGEYIVDVTATQFSEWLDQHYKPIEVFPAAHRYHAGQAWSGVIHKTYKRPMALRAWQVATGWPPEQTVQHGDLTIEA